MQRSIIQKKLLKTMTWTSAGIIGMTSLGIGSFYLALFVKNKRAASRASADESYQGALFKYDWFHNPGLPDFMNENEFKQLDQYLQTHLYYGPESAALNEIIFSDEKRIESSGAAGLYSVQSKQMFIATNYLQKIPNLTTQEKIDSIFPTIAHEYGHHFAYIYFKNTSANDPAVDTIETTTLEKSKSGDKTNVRATTSVWNQKLIDDFTNVHNLTDPNPKEPDPNSYANWKTPTNVPYQTSGLNGLSTTYININNIYSIADLYKSANSGTSADYNQNYYFGDPNTMESIHTRDTRNKREGEIAPRQEYQLSNPYIMSNSLDYRYSADEQIARKLSTYFAPIPLNLWSQQNSNLYTIPEGVFGRAPEAKYWNSTNYDIGHSKPLWNLYENKSSLVYPDYIFGGTLPKHDQDLVQRVPNQSLNLYDNLLKGMGYGKELAGVITRNSSSIINGEQYNFDKLNADLEQIKLFGYSEKKYNFLAIVDNQNQKVVKNIPLKSNGYVENDNDSVFHVFGRDQSSVKFNDGPNQDVFANFVKPDDYKKGRLDGTFEKITNNDKTGAVNPALYSYIMADFVNIKEFGDGANGINHYSLYLNNDPKINYEDVKNSNYTELIDTIYDYAGAPQITTYQPNQIGPAGSYTNWKIKINDREEIEISPY